MEPVQSPETAEPTVPMMEEEVGYAGKFVVFLFLAGMFLFGLIMLGDLVAGLFR